MGRALSAPYPQNREEILQQYDFFEMTQQHISNCIQALILRTILPDSWRKLCNPPNSTQKLEWASNNRGGRTSMVLKFEPVSLGRKWGGRNIPWKPVWHRHQISPFPGWRKSQCSWICAMIVAAVSALSPLFQILKRGRSFTQSDDIISKNGVSLMPWFVISHIYMTVYWNRNQWTQLSICDGSRTFYI